jgi:hypothetical protein
MFYGQEKTSQDCASEVLPADRFEEQESKAGDNVHFFEGKHQEKGIDSMVGLQLIGENLGY